METRDAAIGMQSGNSRSEPSSDLPEKSKRFCFKERSSSHASGVGGEAEFTKHKRHHHRHSSHSHRKRRKTTDSGADGPPSYDDSTSGLHPDIAFRESLWDALGDDEGAAFWQGVYGQPIHKYPDTYVDQQTGQLEQMNEEEYAQFVRRKMWEKSWEGIEVAREEKRKRKESEKKKAREEEQQNPPSGKAAPSRYIFDLDVEKSLARGEDRRQKKRRKGLWEDYLRGWNDLQKLAADRTVSSTGSKQLFLRNKIIWPVETSRRKDVKPEEIERFIIESIQSSADADSFENMLQLALKIERVRWHPDKIQQRYGFMEIDEGTMAGVTATFQVFDRMWNERRKMR